MKKNEKQLTSQDESLLASTMESVGDGILVVDNDGRVLLSNSRFAELWRIPDDLIVLKDDGKLLDFVVDQLVDPEAFLSKVDQLYQSQEEDKDTIVFKDGRVFERFTIPLRQDDKIAGRVWRYVDVTDRKRAEAELFESERRFKSLAENSPDVLFRFSIEHGLEYVSPSVERILGFSPEDLIADQFRLFDLIMKDNDMSEMFSESVEKKKALFKPVFNLDSRDGDTLWLEANATPIKDGNGALTGFEGVIRDVTENKKLQDKLVEKNKELESFAYTVSHDLKTPLVTIDGFAGAILEDYGDRLDEDGITYLERISNSVQKMRLLIDDVLEYSRIGRMMDSYAETDFNKIVADALLSLSGAIKERGVEIVVEDSDAPLYGERGRLIQVFENIIGNAVKYVGDDNPAPRVEVGVETNGKEIVFFVRDNGIGVEEAHHEKIFGIFQRLSPAKNKEGTGIGLAIVKRIVEVYEGRVWLESGPGEGTTFFFTLGAAKQKSETG